MSCSAPRARCSPPLSAVPSLARILIFAGAALMLLGLLAMALGRLNLPLGRLPGDINLRGRNVSFSFPIVTCLLLSVLASAVLWLINRLTR